MKLHTYTVTWIKKSRRVEMYQTTRLYLKKKIEYYVAEDIIGFIVEIANDPDVGDYVTILHTIYHGKRRR
jgi:hypothetical protein